MRLLSYNVLNGGVGRADPIGEVVEAQRADVVVLVEADDDWVVRRIARRLKMDFVVGHGDGHAVAVLSRHPIAASINRAALDAAGPRCWVEARVAPADGPPFAIHAVHLQPRATLADEAKRVGQLERVLAATQPARAAGLPHVLCGDFNANAPAQRIDLDRCKAKTREAYVANGNVIPRDAVAMLLKHGYTDTLAAAAGDSAYDAATFTTYEPGQRVDYIFAFAMSTESAWVETDRLATYASDHYPVGATLHFPDRQAV